MGQFVKRLGVTVAQGSGHLPVQFRGPPPGTGRLRLEAIRGLEQGLPARHGPEVPGIDAGADDARQVPDAGNELHTPVKDIRARSDHRADSPESLPGQLDIALLGPDGVLEVAAVDLGHVPSGAQGSLRHDGPRHGVPRDHHVAPVPRGGGPEGLHVPLEVAIELLGGEVEEPFDPEPLVLVDHEHGEEPADVRPEEHAPLRPRRRDVQGEGRWPFGTDRAPCLDPPVPLGVRFLAEEDDA
jgi:hypothetical protein